MTLFPNVVDATTQPLHSLRMLIVEDDPVMQMGLVSAFTKNPHLQVVGQAMDGESAIASALELQPDLIIMDIGLPYLDGIAATQRIKTQQSGLWVMMLTSHDAEHEILAALSSGADAYCIKGASIERLLRAIVCIQEGTIYLDPQIAHYVVKNLKPPAPNQLIGQLSKRELEVLQLLVDGQTNPEIAGTLDISLSTVKVHIRNIMNKLAVDDRVRAAVVALRSGLV